MRIGHGYDAHAFAGGRELVLGGVVVPHTRGLLAHSDGDVVIHALCDALLGAAALGDIGCFFPDTNNEFKDIDSRVLLRSVAQSVCRKCYKIINSDITIVAQVPRLAPYIAAMRDNLAADMRINTDNVNVKSTTMEKMGAIGREEGIAAYAVVLLGNDGQ